MRLQKPTLHNDSYEKAANRLFVISEINSAIFKSTSAPRSRPRKGAADITGLTLSHKAIHTGYTGLCALPPPGVVLKSRYVTSRDLTTRHHIARVDIALTGLAMSGLAFSVAPATLSVSDRPQPQFRFTGFPPFCLSKSLEHLTTFRS